MIVFLIVVESAHNHKCNSTDLEKCTNATGIEMIGSRKNNDMRKNNIASSK